MQSETDATRGAPEGEAVEQLATEQAPVPSAEQNPEVESQAEQPEASSEAKEEGESQPKRVAWWQHRIDQLTREKWDERREKEILSQRVKTFEDQLAALSRGDGSETPQPDHRVPSVDEIRDQVRRDEQMRMQSERFNESCNLTYQAGTTEFPDFQQSVTNLQMLGAMRPEILSTVLEVGEKDAHKVLYQLGKDPDEASRILNLSPVRMAVELAKLSSAAPKPPVVSKAPQPIAPISGSAQAEKNPEKMSTSEWLVWRNKQLAQRA